jgi:predicted RNA-binding Zn-ribbon protein involved in translation (DUF1610 family)
MPIKIIRKSPDKKVVKRCTCSNCGALLEYTPNDVTFKTYRDYGGGSDTYAEFNCPNCGKKQQICQ